VAIYFAETILEAQQYTQGDRIHYRQGKILCAIARELNPGKKKLGANIREASTALKVAECRKYIK